MEVPGTDGGTGVSGDGLSQQEHEREAPILLVVPAAVLLQWAGELDTWGYFNVALLDGDPALKKQVLADAKR